MKISSFFNKVFTSSLAIALTATSLGTFQTVEATSIVNASVNGNTITISNESIEREFSINNNTVLTSQIVNKVANTTIVPQDGSEDFIINLLNPEVSDDSNTDITEVFPTQVLDRENWSISITNNNGVIQSNPGYLIDGNLNTNLAGTGGQPYYIDIDFGSVQTVSSFSIDKRPGYSDANYGFNGTMGKFELYTSKDGEEWIANGSGEFTKEAYQMYSEGGLHNIGKTVYANFDETVSTQYVRIVQLTSAMDTYGEMSNAELNIYSDEYSGYNWNNDPDSNGLENAILSSELVYDDTKIENTETGKKVTIQYESYEKFGVTYDIDQVIVLEGNDHYMRSFIEISVSDADTAVIDYIDTDRFVLEDDLEGIWSKPDDSEISSMWIGAHELMLGQPVYANGFFMGSEFPAAETLIDGNEVQIRYYSGKSFTKLGEDDQLTTDNKFVSWQNVVGVARGTDTSVVQTDFYSYIEDIATPTDFRKQYNSWYDNMMDITDESIAESFYGSELGFTSQGMEPLDSYVVDDGWNAYYSEIDGVVYVSASSSAGMELNQTGFWEFNEKFPDELYTSSSLTDKFSSTFGLWVGPQGGYNFFTGFAQYLEAMGTGYAQTGTALGTVIDTASRIYLTNFETLFLDYQQRFNIEYWKWDGFASRPSADEGHDHMIGGDNDMYFTSDMWEGWIDVFEAMREDGGDELFINATCYINLSPWLLQWVNAIWIQDSGDTGELNTGDGARHEEKIYYRDEVYYKLLMQNEIQFPLKNIYNHDPIYGVSDNSSATPEVFREYLMANAVRGTAFWEFYYSPSIFTEELWQVNADVVDFAEANHEVLKNAKLFGNQPSQGVYGYSAWDNEEGMISFTNPFSTVQTYEVVVDEKIGAVSTLSNATGIQVEPYVVGTLDNKLSYGDTLSVTLQPNETIIYHFNAENKINTELTSIKVTDENELTIKFNERVSADNVYEVNGKEVTSVLGEDYRTVVLTTNTSFEKEETVTLTVTDIKDAFGKTTSLEASVIAYEDETIVVLNNSNDLKDEDIKDVTQESTGIEFFNFTGEKEVNSTQTFSGTQDFSVEMVVKTPSVNTSLFKQEGAYEVRIDEEGFVEFVVGNQVVSSKEVVTTVDVKAHGTFGTDEYVPTTTFTNTVGNINDNEVHTIHAIREVNGLIKLYIDGVLSASVYDETKINENLTTGTITVGGENFAGYMSDVTLYNKALSYIDAEDYAAALNLNVNATILDRTNWSATASSQMNNATGDGPASSALDGKSDTHWHSSYTDGNNHAVTDHYIEIDFNNEETFDNFIYTSRGGSTNGDIKGYILDAYINEQWVTISEGEFAKQTVNTVALDERTTASKIKLKVVSTHNGENYAAAVEIEVSLNLEVMATQAEFDALQALAIKIDETKYTKETVDAYLEVYNKVIALDVINTKSSTVTALSEEITTAYNALLIDTTLDDAKTDAIDVLNVYVTLDNYREEQQNAIKDIIEKYESLIKESTTLAAIELLVISAKAELDLVKTDEELTKEEAAAALAKAKEDAMTELNEYVDLEDYRTEQQELITTILTNVEELIESKTSIEEITLIVSTIKEDLNEIKTDEELTKEEFDAAFLALTKVVETAYDEKDYTVSSYKEYMSAYSNAKEVLANTEATTVELLEATTKLQDAIDALVKLEMTIVKPVVKPGEEAEFKSNATIDTFLHVLMNGKELDPSCYTLREGSIIITLKAEFLATLEEGTYELSIVSTEGTVSGEFEVQTTSDEDLDDDDNSDTPQEDEDDSEDLQDDGDEEDTPQEEDKEENSDTQEDSDEEVETPDTHDTTNKLLYCLLMIISLLGYLQFKKAKQ